MDPNLQIALVASGSGLFGAVVGGVTTLATTYFGPKWERERVERAEFMELRRKAVISWIDAGQKISTAAVEKHMNRAKLADAFNISVSELTSLLGPDETVVDNFIHGAGSYAGTFRVNGGARRLIIGNAGRILMGWHRGTIPKSHLKPFKLVHAKGLNRSNIKFVESWDKSVEGEVLDS